MDDTARLLPLRVLRWSEVALALLVCARTAWHGYESAGPTGLSKLLRRSPVQPSLRLLIVCDSTAVGNGAASPLAGVAWRRGQRFPSLQIGTRACDGANSAELMVQLGGDERFNMLQVMTGGNDVVRLRGLQALRRDVERVRHRAVQRVDQVAHIPAGHLGQRRRSALRPCPG